MKPNSYQQGYDDGFKDGSRAALKPSPKSYLVQQAETLARIIRPLTDAIAFAFWFGACLLTALVVYDRTK